MTDASPHGDSAANPRPLVPALTRRERWLLRAINLYPPYLGAGIRVRPVKGRRAVDVSMKLHVWNRNYFGTQFGGSLYSMCDPFLCLLLVGGLGGGYVVWDKAADIQFRRPGQGKVGCRFEITPERLAEIRADADRLGKVEPRFLVEVTDEAGEVVARVGKLLYVRRKERERKKRA